MEELSYTIDGIPERVDKALREKARREGVCVEDYLRQLLKRWARNLADNEMLSQLSGKSVLDPDCQAALEEQRKLLDPRIWR